MSKGANKQIKNNYQQALNQIPTSYGMSNSLLGSVSSQNGQTSITPSNDVRDLTNLVNQGYLNLGQGISQEQQKAYNANFAPIMRDVQESLGNQFTQSGIPGRTTSKGQWAVSRTGVETGLQGGQKLYDVQRQAQQDVLSRLGAQAGQSNTLLQLLQQMGLSNAGMMNNANMTRANLYQGLGNQLGSRPSGLQALGQLLGNAASAYFTGG